jgi:SUZ domain
MSRSAQDRIRVQSQSRTGSVNSEDAESSDVGPSEAGSIGGRNSTQNSHKKTLTIEEREAAYNEARSRIFMDFEDKGNGTSTNSFTFSLVSGSASTSRGGSISAGDVSDSISTTPTKTSPSLAKAQWSSQDLIRDIFADVGPLAEESTETNVGRLLVSLQWQHMDKIYSARVQASMIVGDL